MHLFGLLYCCCVPDTKRSLPTSELQDISYSTNREFVQFVFNEGSKEMFYLMMHSTFYLRLYGVGHMVKIHSDSERGKPAAATLTTLSD